MEQITSHKIPTMRPPAIAVVILVLCIVPPNPAHARSWYFDASATGTDKDCDDTSICTIAAPCTSISTHENCIAGGDTLYLAAGDYSSSDGLLDSNELSLDGSAGVITIKPTPSGGQQSSTHLVTMHGSGFSLTGSNIAVEDVVFTAGTTGDEEELESTPVVTITGTNIVLSNVIVHGTALGACVLTTEAAATILINGSSLRDCSGAALEVNGTTDVVVVDTELRNTDSAIVLSGGTSQVNVSRCLIQNTSQGVVTGTCVDTDCWRSGATHVAQDVVIYNNIFDEVSGEFIIADAWQSVRIYHNTMIASATGSPVVEGAIVVGWHIVYDDEGEVNVAVTSTDVELYNNYVLPKAGDAVLALDRDGQNIEVHGNSFHVDDGMGVHRYGFIVSLDGTDPSTFGTLSELYGSASGLGQQTNNNELTTSTAALTRTAGDTPTFALPVSSPLRAAGSTSDHLPSLDFYSNVRGAAIDVGAIMFSAVPATTPEPATPEPVTPEPATPEPVTPEPATPEPVTPEPATPEPVTPEPPTGGEDTPKNVTPTFRLFLLKIAVPLSTAQGATSSITSSLSSIFAAADAALVNVTLNGHGSAQTQLEGYLSALESVTSSKILADVTASLEGIGPSNPLKTLHVRPNTFNTRAVNQRSDNVFEGSIALGMTESAYDAGVAKRIIAGAMSVFPEDLSILSVRPGSIVVSFEVVGDERPVATILNTTKEEMTMASSPIAEELNVVSSSFEIEAVTTSPAPSLLPEDGNEHGGLSMAVVVPVVCGAVLVAGVLAGVAVLLRRKKDGTQLEVVKVVAVSSFASSMSSSGREGDASASDPDFSGPLTSSNTSAKEFSSKIKVAELDDEGVKHYAESNPRAFSLPVQCQCGKSVVKQVAVLCDHADGCKPRKATDIKTIFAGDGHMWKCVASGGCCTATAGNPCVPDVVATHNPYNQLRRRMWMTVDGELSPSGVDVIDNTAVAVFDRMVRYLNEVQDVVSSRGCQCPKRPQVEIHIQFVSCSSTAWPASGVAFV